jgi:hypothetical protein
VANLSWTQQHCVDCSGNEASVLLRINDDNAKCV